MVSSGVKIDSEDHAMQPIALALLLATAQAAPPGESIVAPTGEPEMTDLGARVLGIRTEAEYRAMLAEGGGSPILVPIRRQPEGLSPQARFGTSLMISDKMVGWILDTGEQGTFLILDANANGDLSDDARLPFTEEDGKPVARFRTTVTEEKGSYPLEWKLVIQSSPARLLVYQQTLRRGVVRAGGRDVAFGVAGISGLYGHEHNAVLFDLDGDGKLTAESYEHFRGIEKYVTLGETTYEFSVDRYGRTLTLRPLAEKTASRPSLQTGTPAPDFAFTDVDGNARRLSEYRGKLVLLDFWYAECGPCVADMPKLLEAYRSFRDRGFEIIAIDVVDEVSAIRDFAARQGASWTQVRDKEMELQKLFRVWSMPTYFLIGRDGTILAASQEIRADKEALKTLLEKHLGPKPAAR
jgi:peroxiredoxin